MEEILDGITSSAGASYELSYSRGSPATINDPDLVHMMLPTMQEVLGEDVVGVAPLPAGPVNPSGPLLQSETLMFNAASSPAQTELALLLAEFLTNVEQQTKLARQIGRVPANSLVEVDPRVSPAVAAFVAQTKTAVFIPNVPQIFDVIYLGDETYKQALEGVVSASEAVEQLAERVNARYGFEGNESNED